MVCKSEARVIDLLTMEEKELTHSGMIVFYPVWSPDGKYLAYLQGGIADYGENASLHVFELDTGIAVTILPEGADWFSVAWKPMP